MSKILVNSYIYLQFRSLWLIISKSAVELRLLSEGLLSWSWCVNWSLGVNLIRHSSALPSFAFWSQLIRFFAPRSPPPLPSLFLCLETHFLFLELLGLINGLLILSLERILPWELTPLLLLSLVLSWSSLELLHCFLVWLCT